jgi:hypothetical protein
MNTQVVIGELIRKPYDSKVLKKNKTSRSLHQKLGRHQIGCPRAMGPNFSLGKSSRESHVTLSGFSCREGSLLLRKSAAQFVCAAIAWILRRKQRGSGSQSKLNTRMWGRTAIP